MALPWDPVGPFQRDSPFRVSGSAWTGPVHLRLFLRRAFHSGRLAPNPGHDLPLKARSPNPKMSQGHEGTQALASGACPLHRAVQADPVLNLRPLETDPSALKFSSCRTFLCSCTQEYDDQHEQCAHKHLLGWWQVQGLCTRKLLVLALAWHKNRETGCRRHLDSSHP